MKPLVGDGGRKTIILPVIHYADDIQAIRNAERAFEAGCGGVFLIEMTGRSRLLLPAARWIKERWPGKKIGMNRLNDEAADALAISVELGLDMTWTDEQLTHSGRETWMARRACKTLQAHPGHALFCGVAFKYQAHEPDPALAAISAHRLGFIPTTSGAGTGFAPDRFLVEAIREAIGEDAPLALASGVTPENVGSFVPLVSHILVATGVSASFHEFDPARIRALVDQVPA